MIPPIRILYVDDNPMDRELVRHALEQEPGAFSLIEAAAREQFESLLQETSYDVVLSDFNILGFEGLEVIEAVQAKYPRVPVIIVTGTGSEEVAVEAMKRRAADYVIKSPAHIRRLPFTIHTVVEKERTAIEHKLLQKEYQAALAESERKYRLIFENAPLGILHFDNKGVITTCNRVFVSIMGSSMEALVGFDLPANLTNEGVKAGVQAALSGRIGLYEGEYLSLTGMKLTQVRCLFAPLNSGEGPSLGGMGLVEDISARLAAQEEHRRLATAVEQSADSIMITDAVRRIQYVNPAFEIISGYSSGEVIGKTPVFLKSDEHDQSFYQNLIDTIKNGRPWKGRMVSTRKDGRPFHEDVTISPVFGSPGKIINYVDVAHDISQQLEMEKQLLQAQKMEAVGTLAGGIAHDFNNLLQAVLGYSEFMLQRKREGEPDYVDLQKIYKAGKRGADLVKSLMTFSRKVETKHVPVNLNKEITQIQSLLARTIPKTITIDLRLSGDLELIQADPSQIGQVLMNLGVNARDAMPDGGTLTIETANKELDQEYCSDHLEGKPGQYVLLTVSDTGQGMNKETLLHIFEPFFTTKETGKGTGLGLATVYGIVKNHEGFVMCYSEPGCGTTFRIYFPAIQIQEDSQTPRFESAIQGGNETILIVDDDEVLLELGTGLLSRFGYSVITAGNGKEALEIYQKTGKKISLVILDLIMPEMDGRQCLAEILRIDPDGKVIIASGYSESGHAKDMSTLGAKGFVDKPYNMNGLLRMVREVLDAKEKSPTG